MYSTPDNDTRTAWAQHALEAFVEISRTDEDEAETNIADLIANLCHLAKYNSVQDIRGLLDRAFMNFEAEVEEEEI